MRPIFAMLMLAAGSTVVAAQTAPATLSITASHGCPIWFSADRGLPGAVVQTGSGGVTPARLPSLYLHFSGSVFPANSSTPTSQASRLISARITLHGDTGAGHVEQAAYGVFRPTSESAVIVPSPRNPADNYDLALSRLRNVADISVEELQFADGHTWHATSDSYCHVRPNGFHLVSAAEK